MNQLQVANRDISELTSNAQTAFHMFKERCNASGLDFIVTETYRSQERQNYLYEQGRTRPGNIVTWTKKSRHTSRRAWDIVKRKPNGDIDYSDKSFYWKCGKIAAELNIIWGGTWKQADTPHFEINENWKPPKEELEMTEQERIKFNALVEAVGNLSEKVDHHDEILSNYNYMDENIPKWAEPTLRKLLDSGALKGGDSGLNLNIIMMRVLVILDRLGVIK